MSTGMYCGIAGVKAYQTGIDVIGNNISNVNTYGFKSSRVTYRDVFYQTLNGSTAALNDASKNAILGGNNPSQIGYGATASTIDVLNTRAGMATTGNSRDCYINGEGYFVVQDGNGLHYTRVGSFNVDGDGNIVDGNKRLVCGATATITAGSGSTPTTGKITTPIGGTTAGGTTAPTPIKITNPEDYINISIGSDGTITGQLKTDNSIVTLGQVAIANIPNPSGLTQEGGSYYKAVNNCGTVKYYGPGAGGTGTLVTSALEASNTDLASELTQMIINERGFQANTKIITVNDEMMETLVNMKR